MSDALINLGTVLAYPNVIIRYEDDEDSTAAPFSGETISWAFLNPSLSPYKRSVQVGQESFSTNPAVRLYRYDTNTGEASKVAATILTVSQDCQIFR